jgi:hypothetical protein
MSSRPRDRTSFTDQLICRLDLDRDLGSDNNRLFPESAVELICRMVIPGSHPTNRANVTTKRARALGFIAHFPNIGSNCLSDA